MPVVAIANQKGGVGKTATTYNLAHALSKNRKKILMIDLDPQGSLTDYAGSDPATLDQTVYQVLHGNISVSQAIISNFEGPDLVPANIDLAAVELELAGVLQREYCLADALEDIQKRYDYILLDCPPSLGLLTINALIASDWVLIPVATQYSALRGLERLFDTVGQIQRRPNPKLKILGVLPTMYDSRTLHNREALDFIIERSENMMRVFSPISFTVRVQESPVAKQPIFEYEPKSSAGKTYLELAKEVISECEKG